VDAGDEHPGERLQRCGDDLGTGRGDRLRATVARIPPKLRDDAAALIDDLTLETLERL
jgi:hypothetical protein